MGWREENFNCGVFLIFGLPEGSREGEGHCWLLSVALRPEVGGGALPPLTGGSR